MRPERHVVVEKDVISSDSKETCNMCGDELKDNEHDLCACCRYDEEERFQEYLMGISEGGLYDDLEPQ